MNLADMFTAWVLDEGTIADERVLFDAGTISRCEFEFGPHDDHDDCERMLYEMNAPMPDETDYSGWYGGEQGYNNGLRWSDFI